MTVRHKLNLQSTSPYRAPEYHAEKSQATNEPNHWAYNNEDQGSLQWKFDIVWCILLQKKGNKENIYEGE